MAPTTQKQLHLTAKHGPFELVSNQPIPTPGPGYVLVKIHATALNPVDWKIPAVGVYVEKFPGVLGLDIAGEIVELGEGVVNWTVGDKIFFQGTITNENSQAGFSQYTLAAVEYAARVPPNISIEEASTIPVALATGVIGLYDEKPLGVGLTLPFIEGGRNKYKGQPIVVLGGATSVGQMVIQLAKLSGFYPIITTASIKNASLLTSLGATHVLDRFISDAELTSQISSITSQPITLVYDAVGVSSTQYAGYSLLSPSQPGHLLTVLSAAIKDSDKVANKEVISTLAMFIEPNTKEIGKLLYKELEDLVAKGEIKPNRVEILDGGLAGILGGLEKLRKEEVSAAKLVARPQETA